MLGCDVVAIARIERILASSQDKFLARVFNKSELDELSLKPASIAAYFAAKEAASKALGCGISAECGFYDICIKKDKKNKPSIEFSEKIYENFGVKRAYLSLSHDGGVAMAVVLLER